IDRTAGCGRAWPYYLRRRSGHKKGASPDRGGPASSAATRRRALDYPLRQVLMNFLRSSPASFLSPAVLLQAFIRSCCAFCLADGPSSSPFRHLLMNFLRSSPFLSAAFSLQAFIRSCCFFCASLGSFLAAFLSSFFSVAFLSSAFGCAIATGGAASIRQHSAAISCFISAPQLVDLCGVTPTGLPRLPDPTAA